MIAFFMMIPACKKAVVNVSAFGMVIFSLREKRRKEEKERFPNFEDSLFLLSFLSEPLRLSALAVKQFFI
jgi:hypothetical protein